MEDIATWVAFTMAITALTLACILLSLLRANTNSSSICISLTFCLLMTQCLFLFALKSKMSIVSNEVRVVSRRNTCNCSNIVNVNNR